MKEVKLSLASWRELKKDYAGFINKLIEENGPAFAVKVPFDGHLHFFACPELVKRVLFEKNSIYARWPNKIVDAVLRDSAMLSPEDQTQWREERFTLLNPLLNRSHIIPYADFMIDTVAEEINKWEKYAETNQAANVHEFLTSITIKNLCILLFDKFPIDDRRLAYLIREFFYLFIANEKSLTKLAWKLPTETRRRTQAVIEGLHEMADQIVDYCLSDKATDNNVVRMLAKKYLHNYPNLTKKDKLHLAGRVCVFLIGGFDNIAGHLIWALNFLSQYPLIAQKTYEEIKNKIGSRRLQVSDLDTFTYTKAVILENLRLTISPFIPRIAMEDDHISDDYIVKKYDRVLLQVFYLHHSPHYWENPAGFIPERFLKPLDEKYDFIFIPFSAGPRGCIGRALTMVQTLIILPMILQKYRLYLPPGEVIDPNFQYLDPRRSKPIQFIITKAHDYN